METSAKQGRFQGCFNNLRHCSCYSSPQTKSAFGKKEQQGQNINVGAGVEPPPVERVLASDRIHNLEIQVRSLQDEVARIEEMSLKNSSDLQKTASYSKTVADDTVILATAVKSLTAVVNDLAHSVKQLSRGGRQLQSLLDINSPEAQGAVMSARSLNPRWSPAGACNRLPEGWAEFITLHCACLSALQEGNRADAYDKAVSALQPFLRVFREDESAWVIFPMHNVVHNLRAIAEAADAEARAAGRRADKLADCGDQLRKCFSVSLQAPGNKDKKAAALDIVNVSIKIYFKLNTLRLCKNLIRTVESKQFPPFESFPISQRVTYKFYMGRLAVFDDSYEEAEASLSYALRHCHRTADRNKARILKYLVPVALLLGRLPSSALRQQYPEVLAPYDPLILAIKTGDVGLFNQTMATQQTSFIKDGTYLLLEKLQLAVQRRLLRKVWAIHAQIDPAKAAQIPLSWFQYALCTLGGDESRAMDMDEVECVAANLIFRKYVKGYISHKNKVMVVAKNDPFPSLAMVALNDAS